MTDPDHPRVRSAASVVRARRGSALRAVALALALACLVLGLAAPAAFAEATADSTDDQGNLIVDVTDGRPVRPVPVPRPVTPPGPPAPPQAGPSVTGSDTQATIPDPVAADDALDDPVTSGPIAMSGLSAEASPSLGVGNGSITLSFVVRNNASRPIDATATFWIADVFGNTIVRVEEVEVDALDAGETRRVLVTIDGLGQHVVLRNYVTFVPPATIDDEPVSPLSRNTVVVVPPLFSLALLVGIGAAGCAVWWAVGPRGLGLRPRLLAA